MPQFTHRLQAGTYAALGPSAGVNGGVQLHYLSRCADLAAAMYSCMYAAALQVAWALIVAYTYTHSYTITLYPRVYTQHEG